VARIEVTRAAHAPLAGGDPTRCHAIRADGRELLPGLTRPEADAAAGWLSHMPNADRCLVLVEVTLPVVLSDGAGPHLLDGSGALVLALGPHPHIAGARVAMGAAPPGPPAAPRAPSHVVGVVAPQPAGGWLWLARAEVAEHERVAALDGADQATGPPDLRRWADTWAGAVPTLGE
jgi:hypothetical protein